jgi:hypothetical protein
MANIPANYRQLEGSGLRPAYGSRLLGPAEPSEALLMAVSVQQRPGAPLTVLDLSSTGGGIHDLQILPDHHKAYGQFVTIRDGESTRVTVKLEPK